MKVTGHLGSSKLCAVVSDSTMVSSVAPLQLEVDERQKRLRSARPQARLMRRRRASE